MQQASKAEQLKLPEQLYILLVDSDTGEPLYPVRAVERALATAVLWELLNCGAVTADEQGISQVQNVLFSESYMRDSALLASSRKPIGARHLVLEIAAELHPIWRVIGEDMVNEHLLTQEVRTRFCFFHQRVLTELGEARTDGHDLSESLRRAARANWDENYEAELVNTHPRMLARIVILDNYGLLGPLIGDNAYSKISRHLPSLRAHLHDAIRNTPSSDRRRSASGGQITGDSSYTGSDYYIYDSGTDFWIEPSHSHDGHDGDSDGSSDSGGDWGGGDHSDSGGGWDGGGDSSSSGGDSGGGGGDGGGCSGCGGCGGCGG